MRRRAAVLALSAFAAGGFLLPACGSNKKENQNPSTSGGSSTSRGYIEGGGSTAPSTRPNGSTGSTGGPQPSGPGGSGGTAPGQGQQGSG